MRSSLLAARSNSAESSRSRSKSAPIERAARRFAEARFESFWRYQAEKAPNRYYDPETPRHRIDKELYARDDALREVVKDVIEGGSFRWRTRGVGMLLAGVILVTTGNLVAIAA